MAHGATPLSEDPQHEDAAEGAVAALGSHLDLLAQLVQHAALGGGLQVLAAPLRASSAQLSRGLENRREPCGEPASDISLNLGAASRGSENSCAPCTAPERKRPDSLEIAASMKSELESPSKPSEGTSKSPSEGTAPKVPKWAEDQLVLRELRSKSRTTNLADLEADNTLVENASPVFRYLRGIVGNARYERHGGGFWAAVVTVNTLTMILEEESAGIEFGHRLGIYEKYGSIEYMDEWWPNAGETFFAIDCVLSVMFTIELILTFTYDIWNARLGAGAHFRQPFWTNPWDWLDFAIVVVSNLSLVAGLGDGPVSKARFFRVFRLVRLLRLVRLVRKINSLDPLHLMTTAIQGCLGALMFSTLLLLLIQSMFAMMMAQVMRYGWLSEGSSTLSEAVQLQLAGEFRYFGTYTRSMVTMFELMLANWPEICRFLMEEVHEIFGYFVVGYKLSIGFAVVGVINGVLYKHSRWHRMTSSSW
ncbi:unnamed protein product [Prorocentrum cordatum]|uniref:Ion transport domain-containing protein n=1 Tax=Prorocentrum cordatum TaxID=2364126 RepID=A0ABN9XAD3_9DINO|nr:unnamed protein product [Polarella glacialis]